MAKVQVTVLLDIDFDREAYSEVIEADGTTQELNEEERNALTEQEMLEYDKRFLANGDFDVATYLGYGDYDCKQVELELVDSDPELQVVWPDEAGI